MLCGLGTFFPSRSMAFACRIPVDPPLHFLTQALRERFEHKRSLSKVQAGMSYYQLDTVACHMPFSAPYGGLTR